jgi:hypothetical protein
MEEAKRASANDEHKVINEAIADRGDGYTVFSVVRSHIAEPFKIIPNNRRYPAHRSALPTVGEESLECQTKRLPGDGRVFYLHIAPYLL